jgi:hypothetical protein
MTKPRVLTEYTETVQCPLSESEWRDRAEQIGKVGAKIEELEGKLEVLKSDQKDLKDELDSTQREAVRLARAIRERSELRGCILEEVVDYDINKVIIRVKSDQRTVRMRAISDSERQQILPFAAGAED